MPSLLIREPPRLPALRLSCFSEASARATNRRRLAICCNRRQTDSGHLSPFILDHQKRIFVRCCAGTLRRHLPNRRVRVRACHFIVRVSPGRKYGYDDAISASYARHSGRLGATLRATMVGDCFISEGVSAALRVLGGDRSRDILNSGALAAVRLRMAVPARAVALPCWSVAYSPAAEEATPLIVRRRFSRMSIW